MHYTSKRKILNYFPFNVAVSSSPQINPQSKQFEDFFMRGRTNSSFQILKLYTMLVVINDEI